MVQTHSTTFKRGMIAALHDEGKIHAGHLKLDRL
ncbi:hypothetical protein ABIC55_002143 [Sporosarcina psychrophila]|uniref:Transposase n=1 Tax=Sporosarcina psychrophila TaxID=1476 RepID=A0ABV2K7J5_SPOPS